MSLQCPVWARDGHCKNNPAYMLQSCQLSCGVCPTPASAEEAVVNASAAANSLVAPISLFSTPQLIAREWSEWRSALAAPAGPREVMCALGGALVLLSATRLVLSLLHLTAQLLASSSPAGIGAASRPTRLLRLFRRILARPTRRRATPALPRAGAAEQPLAAIVDKLAPAAHKQK